MICGVRLVYANMDTYIYLYDFLPFNLGTSLGMHGYVCRAELIDHVYACTLSN